jgi:hypothetical protein
MPTLRSSRQRITVGDAHSTPGCLPKLWPSLLICLVAALWIDVTGIHAYHHSDSLLPVLVSLYRWMPFYWDLDRIGMLVPLIAMPIHHPLANLLVQDALYLFASLAAFILLARYVLRDASYPLVGALSIAAFIGLTPGYYRFHLLIDTQYGLWLSFGLGGLLLLEADSSGRIRLWRRIAAIVLLVMAHWCYCTASLFLGPLVVLRWLAFRSVPRHARTRMLFSELVASLVSLCFAFAVGLALMRLSPAKSTNFVGLPVAEWLQTFYKLLKSSWHELAPQWWPLVCPAAAIAGLLLTWRSKTWAALSTAWRAAVVYLGAALAIGFFMATRQWVVTNLYHFRFLLVPALFTQAALLAVAVAACAGRWPDVLSRRGLPLGVATVVLALTASLGTPSLARLRGGLAQWGLSEDAEQCPRNIRSDIHTDDVLATHTTHIAGTYWRVWPAVFRANLALYEQAAQRVVWGVTLKSTPTSDLWKTIPRSQMRVAVYAPGDEEADKHLTAFGFLPLAPVERRSSIVVFEPAELASQATPERNDTKGF